MTTQKHRKMETKFEKEINEVFARAGELLYCDKITVKNIDIDELVVTGVCTMCYKREKDIDEHIEITERLRLFDMLRMGFYGVFAWVNFDEVKPMGYNDDYDLVKIQFELGRKRNNNKE